MNIREDLAYFCDKNKLISSDLEEFVRLVSGADDSDIAAVVEGMKKEEGNFNPWSRLIAILTCAVGIGLGTIAYTIADHFSASEDLGIILFYIVVLGSMSVGVTINYLREK